MSSSIYIIEDEEFAFEVDEKRNLIYIGHSKVQEKTKKQCKKVLTQ